MNKIAIIRIRGMTNVRGDIDKTLKMLNLNNKNHCVVVEQNPTNMGMIKKIKDYVTYGPITDETFKLLVEKRGVE